MTPVIFINCSRYPFIDWIMSGAKRYETRTKNTMKTLMNCYLGKRFLLAETGYMDPLVRCSAVIDEVIAVYTREEWEKYCDDCMITGTDYDWQPDTKVKWLYHLADVKPVDPFRLPKSCRRHGRVWAEYEEGNETKNKFTNILCTYTGGGVYIFNALYNGEVWISTDFFSCGYYDMDPEVIAEKYDCDYDSHWKDYHGSLPTWADILSAVKGNYGKENCTNIDLYELERIIRRYHPDLSVRIDEDNK